MWDKTGLRRFWQRSISPTLSTSLSELCLAIYVGCCIYSVPVMCGLLLCRRALGHMMPTRFECLRCLCEMTLLCSMWQGVSTNIIAVLAWSAWLVGLHCSSLWNCRCMTWSLVCLSQQEFRALRLMFLSLLIYFAPLFGKRPAPQVQRDGSSKKPKVKVEWPVDAYASSLKYLRSSFCQHSRVEEQQADIASEFPFVCEELLCLLLSVYSVDVLRRVLSNDRVRSLQIWSDFVREYAFVISAEAEQVIFDAYLKRFANIVLSMEDRVVQTDRQRVSTLRAAGKYRRAVGAVSRSRLFSCFWGCLGVLVSGVCISGWRRPLRAVGTRGDPSRSRLCCALFNGGDPSVKWGTEATPPVKILSCFWGRVGVQASLSASLEATPLRTEAQRRPLSCNPSPPLSNVSTSHDAPLVLGKSGRRRELSDLGLVPRSR